MKHAIPLAAVALIVLAWWVRPNAAPDQACEPAPVTEQLCAAGGTVTFESVDDRRLKRILSAEATELIYNDRCVPMGDLIEQLSSDTCDIDLPPQHTDTLSPAEVYARNKPSVLIVASVYKCDKCDKWHTGPASGFVITADGVFVTNHHVVDSKERHTLVAMTADGDVYPVKEILAASEADDVAIGRLDLPKGVRLTALPLRTDAPTGTPVTVISHPAGQFYTLTQGYISRYFKGAVREGGKTRFIDQLAIDADYAKGSSGAPLFDDCGNVIGMVKSTRSIYYNKDDDGHEQNLQMVLKQCPPASAILSLID